ncbi:MAG: hypothetical protein AXA67_06045 [Methylothermaceae bacteria B42]|nr:MAG: hypothetical protein AXA67_06045 [Methylothermaceae bacteria B42]HHJ40372.1 PilZ domain-containing protein [Methylothermaceae bacterium]
MATQRDKDIDKLNSDISASSEVESVEIASDNPIPMFCPVTHGLVWQRRNYKGAERRRATRFQRVDIRVLFRPKGLFTRKTPPQPGLVLDISPVGAAIATTIELRKKQKLKLYFQFQDGQVFSIMGRVKREIAENEYQGYGIEFSADKIKFKDHLLRTALEKKFHKR